MKQCINEKQWDEIDLKQKILLRKAINGNYHNYEGTPPNMGQLIEFLGESWYEPLIEFDFENECSCASFLWAKKPEELVDALWEATKFKLNEKLN